MSAVPAPEKPATTTLGDLRPQAGGALVTAGFGDSQSFALLQRVGNALAQSDLIPQQFRGNLPNCIIALELAQRIGASPLMVMQNLYVVHGKPAWSSQFLIAAVNQCGRYTSLQYQWTGEEGKDSWTCRAYATDKRTGAHVQGPAVSLRMAKDQGWYGRKDSKWPSMTELMMVYRAATYFARTNAPELTMGLSTADEVHDVIDTEQGPTGTFEATTESLRTVAAATPVGSAKPPKPPNPEKVVDAEAVADVQPRKSAASGAPASFTDEAAILLGIDKAKDSEAAADILDLYRGHPKYAKFTEAFNARWSETIG